MGGLGRQLPPNRPLARPGSGQRNRRRALEPMPAVELDTPTKLKKALAAAPTLTGFDSSWTPAWEAALLQFYADRLEPEDCGTVLVYINDAQAGDDAGECHLYVSASAAQDWMDSPDAEADEVADRFFRLPACSHQAELLRCYQLLQQVHHELRDRKHPLGSAALCARLHGGELDQLARRGPKPAAGPVWERIGKRFAEGRYDTGVRLIGRVQLRGRSIDGRPALPRHEEEAFRQTVMAPWMVRVDALTASRDMTGISEALAELARFPVKPFERVARTLDFKGPVADLNRTLRLARAQLYAQQGSTVAALADLKGLHTEEATDLALQFLQPVRPPELRDGVRWTWLRHRADVDFAFRTDGDPATLGYLRVEEAGPRVESECRVPANVMSPLDEAVSEVSFLSLSPGRCSQALARAAFFAFQASKPGLAHYLARKACQVDASNQAARQSLEALVAKGVQESGTEWLCLDILLQSARNPEFHLQHLPPK